MSWQDDLLKESKQTFPDPFNDPRRTQKGRGWKNQTPLRTPPKLEDVMGSIYTSHVLKRKLSAPERVMDKAMQYHAAEANRRLARRIANRKDPNRFDLLLFVVCVSLCGLAVWFAPVIAGAP